MDVYTEELKLKNSSYKDIHELYMANHKGSTIWETFFLTAPYPLLIYFVTYIVNLMFSSKQSLLALLTEFLIFVVPIVLLYTVLNAYNHIFFCFLLFMFILSLFTSLRKRNKNFIKVIFVMVSPPQKRPYITYFRAICGILTAFCILAVDFTIFPRRFAKTESYGYGLMDTGVGFYIVSNGIVTKPDLDQNFLKCLKSSLPIFVLGAVRCLSLKMLDYHQHMSEYGVFWNFFFTLAIVKLMCPLILKLWPNGTLYIAISFAVLHQIGLYHGLEAWIVGDSARDGFLSANREGIFSLPGYLSLYMASVYIGISLFEDYIDLQNDLIRVLKLFITSGLLFFLTNAFHIYFNVSRRLVNITYISWILASTTILLGICIIVEIALRVFFFVEAKVKTEKLVPIIIDAVNYNGLTFFVLSNIVTGFINISMKTLYVGPLFSIVNLLVYMLFICFVVSFMHRYHIKLKGIYM